MSLTPRSPRSPRKSRGYLVRRFTQIYADKKKHRGLSRQAAKSFAGDIAPFVLCVCFAPNDYNDNVKPQVGFTNHQASLRDAFNPGLTLAVG